MKLLGLSQGEATIEFDEAELVVLHSCIAEVEESMDHAEFNNLVGGHHVVATALQWNIRGYIRDMGKA